MCCNNKIVLVMDFYFDFDFNFFIQDRNSILE